MNKEFWKLDEDGRKLYRLNLEYVINEDGLCVGGSYQWEGPRDQERAVSKYWEYSAEDISEQISE